MLRRWVGMGCCVVLALSAVACRPRNKAPAPTAAKNAPPMKGGALEMLNKDTGCVLSCPAPTFKLANAAGTLRCH